MAALEILGGIGEAASDAGRGFGRLGYARVENTANIVHCLAELGFDFGAHVLGRFEFVVQLIECAQQGFALFGHECDPQSIVVAKHK